MTKGSARSTSTSKRRATPEGRRTVRARVLGGPARSPRGHATTGRKPFDYVAAHQALGATPKQAEAMHQRAIRLGKRVARGEISLERAREICGVAALLRSA